MRGSQFSKNSRFKLILSAILTTALTACATGPAVYPINGEAAPTINRDTNGKSLSVVVRLYQLKERTDFDRLTFDTATSGKSDQELFGASLVSMKEVVLVPGGKQQITEKLEPDTRFVGIVGYFRKPDPQAWRYLIDAKDARKQGLIFKVEDCYLEITAPTPQAIPGQSLSAKPVCSTPFNAKPAAGKR